ncbi:LamG-like jellyroll fold domain-containing protein [Reichenbachiella sp. MALMAid0571]|uniref:LamG-like jellyroll fold domain-containing protein n=1 Tax=Reichenbachiella sp. MALMAid0571 TaxID=3143939 RepID=UPI0032E030C0
MVLPKLKSVKLIAIFCTLSAIAQGQTCLDDFCYLTAKYSGNISGDLILGYRAFLVDTIMETSELAVLDSFLKENPEERISLILSHSDPSFYDRLEKASLADQAYPPDAMDSLFGVVVQPSDRLFVFADQDEYFLPIDRSIWQYGTSPDSIENVFSKGKIDNHLTYLKISDELSVAQGENKIKDLINKKGRLPNFLETNQAAVFKAYLDSLNVIRKYKAIVVQGAQYLDEVSWRELPELESTGKIHVSELIISPLKSGFRFSPDVSRFTPENKNVIKIFYANFHDLNERLMMHLDFDHNIVNQVRPEDKYLYGFVKYDEDERGVYSNFDGERNYIDFGIPSGMDFQEITVSAWVKPDTLNGNKSIVGIGSVFSAKVREGKLTFTTPAIRDHQTDSAMVKTNEWQHIAFVYNANKEMNFYYNGKNVGKQRASDITITSHSLLIGNNLWSEYFKGGIDDLYIWNRVLSDEEIWKVYNKDLEKSGGGFTITLLFVCIGGLLVFGVGYSIFKSKSKKTIPQREPLKARPIISNEKNQPGIYLFGGFRLINKNGENLSDLFSPKRKELFVLVLLYTFRKNGINSKQMSEILWEGHSFESAKNNRSTQMKRIREILADNTGLSIDYDNKNWKIKIDDGIRWDFSDYSYFSSELKNSKDIESIEKNVEGLLSVINQGVLLPNMHYEWLDPIKGQLSEEIVEVLTPLIERNGLNLETELKLKIFNSIFSLDPLNEKALNCKIKLLVSEGKHTLAKNAFDHFCSSYSQFYGEKYDKEFSALI